MLILIVFLSTTFLYLYLAPLTPHVTRFWWYCWQCWYWLFVFFPGRFPSLFILHFWHHTWHDDVVAVGNVEIDCLLTFFIGRVFFLLHPGHHAYRDVSDVVDNVDIDYLLTFFLGCISSLSHTLHTTLVMMLVMLLGVRLSLDTEHTRSGCPWDGKLGLQLGCW